MSEENVQKKPIWKRSEKPLQRKYDMSFEKTTERSWRKTERPARKDIERPWRRSEDIVENPHFNRNMKNIRQNIYDFSRNESKVPLDDLHEDDLLRSDHIICTCNKCDKRIKCFSVVKKPLEKESKHVVASYLVDDTTLVEKFVEKHNSKYTDVYKFCEEQRDAGSDKAFKIVCLNASELSKDIQPTDNISTIANKAHKAIIEKIVSTIGHDTYDAILQHFKTINRDLYNRPLQKDPAFKLSWGLTNMRCKERLTLSQLNGESYRVFEIENTSESFLEEIITYLKKHTNKSIVFQVIIPDGKWNTLARGGYARYSDIQIGEFGRGRKLECENMLECVAREVFEEIGDVSLNLLDARIMKDYEKYSVFFVEFAR
jgi:hypothetical protein